MHKLLASLIVVCMTVAIALHADARGMGGQSCDQNAQANSQPAQPVQSSATAADKATTSIAPATPEQIAASRVGTSHSVESAHMELACGRCSKEKTVAKQQVSQNVQLAQSIQAQPNVDINKKLVVKSTRNGPIGKLLGLNKPSIKETDTTIVRN